MDEQMRAIIPTFLDAPNAAGAIASGVMHCTTILNGFFTQEVQGVPLVDWLRAMLGGALPQEWRLLDDRSGADQLVPLMRRARTPLYPCTG